MKIFNVTVVKTIKTGIVVQAQADTEHDAEMTIRLAIACTGDRDKAMRLSAEFPSLLEAFDAMSVRHNWIEMTESDDVNTDFTEDAGLSAPDTEY